MRWSSAEGSGILKRYRNVRLEGAALVLAVVGTLSPGSSRRVSAAGSPAVLLAPAPELTGARWLNSDGEQPVTLASRRGKVTVLHFWTFG